MARLTMKSLSKGMRVQTKVEKGGYYGKDKDGQRKSIPAGSVGVIRAVDVPCVRHTKGRPTAFVCVDFDIAGPGFREERGAFFTDEIKLA